MAQGSAGVKAREIDLTGPVTRTPTGVPAGVIGTSLKGPAFLPVTIGNMGDFFAKFGRTDGKKFGPLAANEWLRNAGSLTYLRVLGVGDGLAREEDGSVNRAGFVVGDDLPTSDLSSVNGFKSNEFANAGGAPGRTHFLGSFMAETEGSNALTSAGLTSPWRLVGTSFQQGVWCRYGVAGATPDNDKEYSLYVNTFKYSSALHRTLVGSDFLASEGDIVMGLKATYSVDAPGDEEMIVKFDLGSDNTFSAGTASGVSWTAGQGSASSGSSDGNLMIRVNKTSGVKLDQRVSGAYVTTGFLGFVGTPVSATWSSPSDKTAIVWINKTQLSAWVDDVSTVFTVSSFKALTNVIFTPADLATPLWPETYIEWHTTPFALPVLRGVVMTASGVLAKVAPATPVAPGTTTLGLDGAVGTVGKNIGYVDSGDGKQEFVLLLNGHKGTDARYPNVLTASFDMTAPNYFGNVLNSDPLKINESGHCLYASWDVHPAVALPDGTGVVDPLDVSGDKAPSCFLLTGSSARDSSTSTKPNYEGFEDRFSHAKSPWVISQKFAGRPANLFRLHALDAGASVSDLYKISIENITPAFENDVNQYGTFDLVIRDWSDRDAEMLPLEQFRGLSLDPSNDRYISKVIGDAHIFFDFERADAEQKIVMDGNYAASSNLVRVEVSDEVDGAFIDPKALPMGFRGIDHLVTSGTDPLKHDTAGGLLLAANLLDGLVTPPLPMRLTVKENVAPKASVNSRLYWGVQFEYITDLTKPNASKKKNLSLKSYTKYFPSYDTSGATFSTGSNPGQPDSVTLGVLDSDKFCNNLFTLEKVMVKADINGVADTTKWVDAVYSRDNVVPSGMKAFEVTDLSVNENRRFGKFTFIMQGGFDGLNVFDVDSLEMNNAAVITDISNEASRGGENGPTARAYLKALDIMKNVVNVDLQLLAIPGIREEVITNSASEAVRDRFDALYLMDISEKDNLGVDVTSDSQNPSVTLTARGFKDRTIDNSFAAAYYPDVIVRDPTTGTNVIVPPSVAVLGALALNDRVAHPWFAPAGLARGALDSVIDVKVKLNQTNLDTLYDVNINPLVSPRAGDRVTVWGQKTLQAGASALNRVNVRRLLIEIRRQVRDIAQSILFEPNRAATLARFSAAVTPRLARIQSLSGLERFKVVIDSSTTSQQDVENNTIRGKIFVQPTKSVEFVSLDFVVSNTAAQ
jgi:phage tail sheath protein FI